MKNEQNFLTQAGTVLGIGLFAGLAGTAALTLSKKLDKKTADERRSEAAALEVVSKVLDVKPTSEDKKDKVIEEIHWGYGALWGVARGALNLVGIRGVFGTLAHFGLLWYGEKMCLPDMKKVFPDTEGIKSVTEEDKKTTIRDSLHLGIYAVVCGIVFDAIMPKRRKKDDK